jgi:AraC-like DNA-binding protein
MEAYLREVTAMESSPARRYRAHPGIQPFLFTATPHSPQFRDLQEFVAASALKPVVVPISAAPSLNGLRLGGSTSAAYVFHAAGLAVHSAGVRGRPKHLHISDEPEAGSDGSVGVWFRTDASHYEAPFVDRSRGVSLTVPISSVPFDLGVFDLTSSTLVTAAPIAIRCLRAIAEMAASDVSGWIAASPESIDKYLIGVAGLIMAAIYDERSDVFLERDRSWLRTRARSLIDAQFFDPALAPATIAAKLGVSLRSLHRAFEGDTGVAETLRTRRVEQAALLLSDYYSRQLPVSEIARRSGFASMATFERSFANVHDVSPHRFRTMTLAR